MAATSKRKHARARTKKPLTPIEQLADRLGFCHECKRIKGGKYDGLTVVGDIVDFGHAIRITFIAPDGRTIATYVTPPAWEAP